MSVIRFEENQGCDHSGEWEPDAEEGVYYCLDCGARKPMSDEDREAYVCLATEPAEPDCDAVSFAESHEAAWRQKGAVR